MDQKNLKIENKNINIIKERLDKNYFYDIISFNK
jgi:hypothetical protein